MKKPEKKRRTTKVQNAFVPRAVFSIAMGAVCIPSVACSNMHEHLVTVANIMADSGVVDGGGQRDLGFIGVAQMLGDASVNDASFSVADLGFTPDLGEWTVAFMMSDASVPTDAGSFSVADLGFRDLGFPTVAVIFSDASVPLDAGHVRDLGMPFPVAVFLGDASVSDSSVADFGTFSVFAAMSDAAILPADPIPSSGSGEPRNGG